jgi:DivIVA domain-containing protein
MARKRKDVDGTGAAGPALEPRRVTPVDIQQKEFSLAMRGYREREVDEFLDEVTEEVARLYAENKRLREELELKGTVRMETGSAVDAAAIVQQARERAARIEAEARAALPPGAAGDAAALGPFLTREKEFLQSLASLIQGHAEGVKEQARRARAGRPRPDAPTTSPEPAAEQPEPGGGSSEEEGSPTPGPPTEVWSPGIAGRGPAAPEAAGPVEALVDLTGQDVSAGAAEDDDRSIRELFWGED